MVSIKVVLAVMMNRDSPPERVNAQLWPSIPMYSDRVELRLFSSAQDKSRAFFDVASK